VANMVMCLEWELIFIVTANYNWYRCHERNSSVHECDSYQFKPDQ
jgi:hypothetical protein